MGKGPSHIIKNMSKIVTAKNIKETLKVFEEALLEASSDLSQGNQVGVERLKSLDSYTLSHPRGILGLLDQGSDYVRNENIKSGVVIMKRSLLIGVVSIIRFIDNPKQPLEKYDDIMMPSEYSETAIDAIAGIEVESTLPEWERKIIPVRTELVDETGGIWKYLTTFSVPMDFVEKEFRK